MRAVTDSGPTEKNQKKPEAIHNLFTLMEVVSKQEVISQFEDMYNDCTIRYGDLKKQLAEDMVTFTEPFREKITELSANEEYIKKVMNQGAEKARESAQKTINEVREIIGFRKYH